MRTEVWHHCCCPIYRCWWSISTEIVNSLSRYCNKTLIILNLLRTTCYMWESISNNNNWILFFFYMPRKTMSFLSTERLMGSHFALAGYHFIIVNLCYFHKGNKFQMGKKKGMHYCRIVIIIVQDINHTKSCEFLADNKRVIDWSLKSHANYEHNPHSNAGP